MHNVWDALTQRRTNYALIFTFTEVVLSFFMRIMPNVPGHRLWQLPRTHRHTRHILEKANNITEIYDTRSTAINFLLLSNKMCLLFDFQPRLQNAASNRCDSFASHDTSRLSLWAGSHRDPSPGMPDAWPVMNQHPIYPTLFQNTEPPLTYVKSLLKIPDIKKNQCLHTHPLQF